MITKIGYTTQKKIIYFFPLFSFFRLALEEVDLSTLATNQGQILVATIKAMEPTQSNYILIPCATFGFNLCSHLCVDHVLWTGR